jgi:hypothetical protein
MTWAPGLPVVTAADVAEWKTWRTERKRQQQRDRRARYPRIDYYPDKETDALIRSLSGPFVGGDFSSVINRIVSEWADRCHRNKFTPKKGARTTLPPD